MQLVLSNTKMMISETCGGRLFHSLLGIRYENRKTDAVLGAKLNLAKALLYASKRDEIAGVTGYPHLAPITSEYLDFDEVMEKFDEVMEWLARTYINALNIIHDMHDKYCYEALEMALHDMEILRTMACGIAGLSVVVDSLSATKYARVKPIRNEIGLAVDFEIEGDFPHVR